MMDVGRPIVSVGGSADTRRLLPRLGWTTIGHAHRHVRPLRPAFLKRSLRRGEPGSPSAAGVPSSSWALLAGGVAVLLFRPRVSPPPQGVVRAVECADAELLRVGRLEPCGTVPLPNAGELEWLARSAAPERRFVALSFEQAGERIGWALLRIEGPAGAAEAQVLEMFARDGQSYRWLAGELASRAFALGAIQATALTACPAAAEGLARAGFWARDEKPVYCWPAGRTLQPPLHLGWNVGDAGLMPYAERWPVPGQAAGS
jgi:hypothetical protein